MEKEYKGVSWNRQKQRWISRVISKGITYDCGSHAEQVDAVKARDRCIIHNGLGVQKLQIIKPRV
jgi:hypothetical protein